MKKTIFSFLFLALCLKAFTQVPSTDIYVADMKKSKEGIYTFSKPVNITNREGYDNQPAFTSSGRIYYTSLRDSTKGTDIYFYDPSNGNSTRVTKTSESEYSPGLMPGNKWLSVVRVDKDSLQRVYQVSTDGRTTRLLLKSQDSVGYYCWVAPSKMALYILGDSAELRIADIKTQHVETVVTNIARCIAAIPGTNQISYIEKVAPDEWYIKAYDPDLKKSAFLMKTLEGAEDYAWTPDKKLLMGKNGKLYISDPYNAVLWKEIADFSRTIGNFYRIAINTNGTRIAFVSYKGDKP
jgi:hypothetical protein